MFIEYKLFLQNNVCFQGNSSLAGIPELINSTSNGLLGGESYMHYQRETECALSALSHLKEHLHGFTAWKVIACYCLSVEAV